MTKHNKMLIVGINVGLYCNTEIIVTYRNIGLY